MGKCVISLAAGTTCKSSKNLDVFLCVCGVETPLSHNITFLLPSNLTKLKFFDFDKLSVQLFFS